jgi:hypothetical protein
VLQLRVYAVLWNHDQDLNPEGWLATQLVLAYIQSDVEVAAPTHEEMDVLEADLAARGAVAQNAVANAKPIFESRVRILPSPFTSQCLPYAFAFAKPTEGVIVCSG